MVLAAAVAALLAAAGTTIIPTASAQTPNLPFNISVRGDSPYIRYSPDPYNQLFNGSWWLQTYTQSPWSSYQPNMIGFGDPMTIGFGPGNATGTMAMLSVEFAGTGIYFYGGAAPVVAPGVSNPIMLLVDNGDPVTILSTDPSSHQNLFAYATGLDFGMHTASIGILSGNLTLEYLDIETALQSPSSSLSGINSDLHLFVKGNNLANDIFTFNGNWTVETQLGGGGGQQPVDIPIAVGYNSADVQFDVPANTSYMILNGTIGPDNGFAFVSVTPSPKYQPTFTGFNEYNPWLEDCKLYFAPLDPTVQYHVKIKADSPNSGFNAMNKLAIGLFSVDFFSSNGTSTGGGSPLVSATTGGGPASTAGAGAGSGSDHKTSSNTGAIAGGVVGGVVGLATIAGAIFFFCRRRSSGKKNLEQGPATFEVDESAVAQPYIHNAPDVKPMTQHNSVNGAADIIPVAGYGQQNQQQQYGQSQQQYSQQQYSQQQYGYQPEGNQFMATRSQSGGDPSIPNSSGYQSSDLKLSNVNSGQTSPRQTTRDSFGVGSSFGASVAGGSAAGAIEEAKARNLPNPPQGRTFSQEEDAGGVELIPPSYRPEWAPGSSSGASGSGGGGAPEPIAGLVPTEEPRRLSSATTGTGDENFQTPRGSSDVKR